MTNKKLSSSRLRPDSFEVDRKIFSHQGQEVIAIQNSLRRRRQSLATTKHSIIDCKQPEHAQKILRKESKFSLVGRSRITRSVSPDRLSGPVQLVNKILESWRLEMKDAAILLGFEASDQSSVSDILNGRVKIDRRDIKDRIAYLIQIRSTLFSLFRAEDIENEWLRETHAMLGNRAPLDLLLEGSMENLLLVKEFCDEAAGI